MASKAFSDKVLDWFDRHGRKNLPWQKNINPYRVWLSEIMLQQTQVATVIPYFETFTKQFPTVDKLAAAPLDDVLHLWSGLGYYARARNLHACANNVVELHKGQFPNTVEALEQLPGIGRSTAGAIVSIAFKKPAAILDGNVKRVLARHFAIEGSPTSSSATKAFWAIAEANTPEKRAHHYSQAMMDLGATVCTRSNPACGDCPLKRTCKAYKAGAQNLYPQKKPRKQLPVKQTRMLLIIDNDHQVLLLQRPPSGIWGGLWSFPELSLDEDPHSWCRRQLGFNIKKKTEQLPPFRHTFSHYHLDIHPQLLKLGKTASTNTIRDTEATPNQLWYNTSDRKQARLKKGLAAPVSKLLAQLQSELTSGKFD